MRHCMFRQQPSRHKHQSSVSRRAFLQSAALAAAGLVAAGCQGPTSAGSTAGTKAKVAIAKAANYDPKLIRQQVQAVLDGIGGVSDILAHGNRVAIKTNLTGGTGTKPLPGISEIESYLTHPEVVRALVELLRDAGAKDIYIVEAVYEPGSWPHYGYTEMAKAVGATLVDLNDSAPNASFVDVEPGTSQPIYEKYRINPILQDVDAFISVSKMKCHNTAGVTHTMKNLFGIVPYRHYTINPGDGSRTAFHGNVTEAKTRVPNIIVDLNKLRPINLGLIDGILTTEAGEGPWIQALTPIAPGLLFAGKDPVATDAVATAAMGFDPETDFPDEPFVHGINHLKLAAKAGLGINKLAEIQVVGETLQDVIKPFTPSF